MNQDKYLTVEEFANQLHAYIDKLEKKYKDSNNTLIEAEVMGSLHKLTDEELEKGGWKLRSFDDIPRIISDECIEQELCNESDREQEEFIEQCRRDLEARVKELRIKRLQ